MNQPLPTHQAGITIGFVVIGVLLLLLRARLEAKRGKRSRATWLAAATLFGPLFAVTAFWSRTVTHATKIALGRHADIFMGGVIGFFVVAILVWIGARAYVARKMRGGSPVWNVARFVIPPVVGVAAFFGARLKVTKGLIDHIDTAASGLALVFAVVFVVGVLSAMLPWLLDR